MSVAATLDVSALISGVSATAAAAAAPTDAVEVTVIQTTAIDIAVPTGTTSGEMAAALTTTVCNGEIGCQVVAGTATGRRLALDNNNRRGLQSSTTFTVTRELDSSSSGSLAPPTVNTTNLAANLGVTSVAAPTVTLQEVSVEINVISEGSPSSAAAQSQAATQTAAFTPSALAAAVPGLSASALTVQAATVIGPPPPPPLPPPLPPPPPSPPPPALPAGEAALDEAGAGPPIGVIAGAGGGGAVVLLILAFLCYRRMKAGGSDSEVKMSRPKIQDLDSKPSAPRSMPPPSLPASSSAPADAKIEVRDTTQTYVDERETRASEQLHEMEEQQQPTDAGQKQQQPSGSKEDDWSRQSTWFRPSAWGRAVKPDADVRQNI